VYTIQRSKLSEKNTVSNSGRDWCNKNLFPSARLLAAAEVTVQAPAPPPVFNPPKTYYLALGDSVTYGYQAAKVRAGLPPSAFNTGYVDVFGARLRQIQPGITIVNYGCPGETSFSFIYRPAPLDHLRTKTA